MKVKLIVEGGKMQPGPAVSQQLGPMGINLGKVISDVNEATKGFAGMKVPVELDVNPKTKDFTISVSSPPIAELMKKSLGVEKGSGQPNKVKVGNLAFETLLGIVKTKMPDFLAKDLKAGIKLSAGTCVSLGILIDSKDPKQIIDEINEGNYDKEINEEITEPSSEKLTELKLFFDEIKAKQDKDQKALEEAKAAKEAEDAKKVEKKEAVKEDPKEAKKEEPKKK